MNPVVIQTKLESQTVQLPNAIKDLLGKDVIITIEEKLAAETVKVVHTWNYLGAIATTMQLDALNLRDFAHE